MYLPYHLRACLTLFVGVGVIDVVEIADGLLVRGKHFRLTEFEV